MPSCTVFIVLAVLGLQRMKVLDAGTMHDGIHLQNGEEVGVCAV